MRLMWYLLLVGVCRGFVGVAPTRKGSPRGGGPVEVGAVALSKVPLGLSVYGVGSTVAIWRTFRVMHRDTIQEHVPLQPGHTIRLIATAGCAVGGIESLVLQSCGFPSIATRAPIATIGALFFVISYLGDWITFVNGILATFLAGFVATVPLWRLLANLA